jgi:hypothetical protein
MEQRTAGRRESRGKKDERKESSLVLVTGRREENA